MILSSKYKNNTPKMIYITTIIHLYLESKYVLLSSFKEGIIKGKIDALSVITPANPKNICLFLLINLFEKNTKVETNDVAIKKISIHKIVNANLCVVKL